jgi:hypothetical protein
MPALPTALQHTGTFEEAMALISDMMECPGAVEQGIRMTSTPNLQDNDNRITFTECDRPCRR